MPRVDAGPALYGRTHDLAFVGAFVDGAATDGGSLLIAGEAGVGKSALLRAAAAHAADEGVQVLRAVGARFEGDLRFAGLHQALHPLLDDLGNLARHRRNVLMAALGLAPGPVPAQAAVTAAVTALLRQASQDRPILLTIDDLSWLDPDSVAVLRGLEFTGSRIGMMAVTRHDFAEAPTHVLEPLDEESAAALLGDRFPGLSPAAHRRVLAEARGNPLALLELPAALDAAQRSGAAPLPPALRLNRRLRAAFAGRVARLSAPVRHALLLVALDRTGDLPGAPVTDALRQAEDAGLVDVDQERRRVTFRHPLFRSAVVELATAGEQRRAHEALARRRDQDAERRVWHLAHAAVEPDEHVAGLLEELAGQVRARGDVAGAVAALARAAALSPDSGDRSRRASIAAYLGADATGQLLDVRRLLDDADTASLTTALAAAHHLLLSGNGDVDAAYRMLADAVEAGSRRPDTSPDILREGIYTLVWISFFGARAELWQPLERAVAGLPLEVPESLALLMSCFADPVRTPPAALRRLDAAIGRLDAATDPVEVIRIGMAGKYVGRLEACRPALRRLLDDGRDVGHVTLTIHALNLLSRHCYETGEWDELARLGADGLRLSEGHGYRLLAQTFVHRQGLLAASRGDSDRAEEHAGAIIRFAAPRRLRAFLTLAAEIRTRAAIGRGEYEEAFRHATSMNPAGALLPYQACSLWLIFDVVESAVRTGRHAEAEAHVAAVLGTRVPAMSGRLALVAHGAAALAADDGRFVKQFERALAVPDADCWPFDLARVRLAYGERLRRVKTSQAAREQLTAAVATFERLGAAPWAERAHSELRASGLAAVGQAASPDNRLSPQQYEIARLAAGGMTNKQIGERLQLSPRTVGTHLYQIFPKLGITSRAALRDALQQQ